MDGAIREEGIAPGHPVTPLPTSDRGVLLAAQKGSPEALEALVRRHWPKAVQVAYSVVRDKEAAEDLAQESMMTALESLDRFDRRRPFAPWLHRIVVNRSIDWARAVGRRAEVGIGDLEAQQAPRPEPPSPELIKALRSLTPEDRAIVALAHLMGYRAREIGKIMDLKPGTVRSRLSRAIAHLRAELTEQATNQGGSA